VFLVSNVIVLYVSCLEDWPAVVVNYCRRASCACIAKAAVRNINICGRILTQFTGLLLMNTVTVKRILLAERTGLGKSVSVSLRKNVPTCLTPLVEVTP